VRVANELLTEGFEQMRRSERLAYGCPLLFSAREVVPTFGFTFNISEGGLFVRTLTPPPMGTALELKFTPPFGRGQVWVEGNVAWRSMQRVNPRGVPSGFGLSYGELPVADGAALAAGYAELLANKGGV